MLQLDQGLYIHTTPSTINTNCTKLYKCADDGEDDDPLKTLSHDYMNLFSNGDPFSDIVFIIEGKQVKAHRCILSSRSNYFKTLFYKYSAVDQSSLNNGSTMVDVRSNNANPHLQIPVEIVSYDVFVILLKFLYSGQLILNYNMQSHDEKVDNGRTSCFEKACWHLYCSSLVELALDTLHAANLFGMEQLSLLIQRHLVEIVEKMSIDDVMRVLVASKKMQGAGVPNELWERCSELVARSGLKAEMLRKHLPGDMVTEIEEMRSTRMVAELVPMMMITRGGYIVGEGGLEQGTRTGVDAAMGGPGEYEEQRVRKMRQALECQDMELVRLMVMGEGLDLDTSEALHYAVSHCSREVVKGLLEMGVVNVNASDGRGRTALHLACEMGSPDMICLLLDHHASPSISSHAGHSPIDIIADMISAGGSGPSDQTLRLSLELLQSAAFVNSQSADAAAEAEEVADAEAKAKAKAKANAEDAEAEDEEAEDEEAEDAEEEADEEEEDEEEEEEEVMSDGSDLPSYHRSSACASDGGSAANSEIGFAPLMHLQSSDRWLNPNLAANYYDYYDQPNDENEGDYGPMSANYRAINANHAANDRAISVNHPPNYAENPNYSSVITPNYINFKTHYLIN